MMQRADQRDDLQRAPHVASSPAKFVVAASPPFSALRSAPQNAWPIEKWNRNRRGCGLPLTSRPGNRVELVAEIDAQRADRRQVAKAGADVVAQVAAG